MRKFFYLSVVVLFVFTMALACKADTTTYKPLPPLDTYEQNLQSKVIKSGYAISLKEANTIQAAYNAFTSTNSQTIANLHGGGIVLQVESAGEAWYVDPVSKKKFYLKDGKSAYAALYAFGLGITNKDLAKIPLGLDKAAGSAFADSDGDGITDYTENEYGTDPKNVNTDGDAYHDGQEVENNYDPLRMAPAKLDIDLALANRLKGRILLQVESRGQAWYVHPDTGRRYYLRDGDIAYEIMRILGKGISNTDINTIPVGQFY